MNILFANQKMAKLCNSLSKSQKKWGDRRGRLVIRRLDEIRDSANMAVLKTLPGARLHPLLENRKGQYSVDLEHPYRLLFEIADDPVPQLEGGRVDYSKVSTVRILEVENTHD